MYARRPEATGVIGASVYILLLALFAPLPYLSALLPSAFHPSSLPALNTTASAAAQLVLPEGDPCAALLLEGSLAFPHHSFATYLASLLSLLIATFLGFCDDVFDIRWRFKLPIPSEQPLPAVLSSHERPSLTLSLAARSHRLGAAPRHLRRRTRRHRRRTSSSVPHPRAPRRGSDQRRRPPRCVHLSLPSAAPGRPD